MCIKQVEGFVRNLNRFLVVILVVSYALPVMAQTSSPESKNPDPEKKIEFTPPKKDADELFKEAAGLSEKNPEEAVRLYQRAFQSKPDAWDEHRKMALLYEKLGKLNAAATEYESINNAVGTAQSNADLARILEKTGALPAAAAVAFHGAQKFPDDSVLTIFAGDLLLKSGQTDRALEFLKRLSQKKIGDNKILFLLGQAYEKQGNEIEALRAYLKGMDSGAANDEQKKILERLGKHAVHIENIWVFLPKGWERDKNILINAVEGHKLYVDVHPEGDLNAIALKIVREKMPAGLFDDEKIKGHEEMRKMASELSKTSPDAGKGMMLGRLPVFNIKPIAEKMKGLMVLASSSEEPSDLIQSTCALVLPSGNKIYSVALVCSKSNQEGEKALLSLIDYIVLP